MGKDIYLNIGKEFSEDPRGRYYSDGPASGEHFREDFLLKAIDSLETDESLKIILDDDVEAYGSSFLTEGFAGLVKYGYFEKDKLLKLISFVYTDQEFEFYENRIYRYIEEAKFDSVKYIPTKTKSD